MKATIIIALNADRGVVRVVRGRRRHTLRGIVHHEYHDNEMRAMAETVHTVRHIVSPNATPSTSEGNATTAQAERLTSRREQPVQ